MGETQGIVLFGMADQETSRRLGDSLRKRGFEVCGSASAQEILEIARRRRPEVAILDEGIEMGEGQLLIRLLKAIAPEVRVIHLLPAGSRPDREAQPPFVCTLVSPISENELAVVIGSALAARRSASATEAPPLIFCVDDDAPFLKSLVRLLRRHGYSAVGYEDPEKALEGVPLYKPSLVFIDILMPGMNGLDLAAELRDDYGSALPFVLLSARSSDHEVSEGYRAGARSYLTKPCEPNRIVDVADALLRKPGSERELLNGRR